MFAGSSFCKSCNAGTYAVEHVTDIAKIAGCGIFSTPGVVIDGEVKSLGKIPSKAEVKK
ncbi:MAG: thioredoxin family protein [Desulfobacteraceae bacterium]|nr:thioredoxin family protein [Desulfobacteraceae bacterium]